MYSYFIDIDIAKNTHWASCISSDGEIILEPFSFSNDNPSLPLQIKHAILQIELYDDQIAEVEALYKQILDEMNTPILTIPGMSYIN